MESSEPPAAAPAEDASASPPRGDITDDTKEINAVLTSNDSEGADESARLKDLTAQVRDQDELERDVARQADKILVEQADERDQTRLEKTRTSKEKLLAQQRRLQQRLSQPAVVASRARIQVDLENIDEQIKGLDEELVQIQQRIDERHQNEVEGERIPVETAGNRQLPNESRRDFLIRTGKITPFSKLDQALQRAGGATLQEVILDAEEGESEKEEEAAANAQPAEEPVSHQNLRMPGFLDEEEDDFTSGPVLRKRRPAKRRRLEDDIPSDEKEKAVHGQITISDSSADEFVPDQDREDLSNQVTDDGEAQSISSTPDSTSESRERKRKRSLSKGKNRDFSLADEKEDFRGVDDGNEHLYQARLKSWVRRRAEARGRARLREHPDQADTETISSSAVPADEEGKEEWHLPHPTVPDTEISDGYRIPGDVYPSLFDYQKTGAQWLWELYSQHVGGIIGDEMGLGKTIQVISFLAGLHYSGKLTKPILVVAPATVLKQWVNEFHRWWPPFRVSILHSSGSGMMNVSGEERLEEEIEEIFNQPKAKKTKGKGGADRIVDTVVQKGHVLVTTYAGLQNFGELLIPIDWEYAILDEGHKIRNPNTAITIYCKELRTPNRIILSGTPMQNNLTELWSLFDFVFPMRLGTLVNFRNQFEFPIKIGGYANASNLQVQTAIRCAETLKGAISPYLLQRLKVDVASDLPTKSEQVLFCKLTRAQRQMYERYLGSDDVKAIMKGSLRSFAGISKLRKICNHPDLIDRDILKKKANYEYGDPAKSGKMHVVQALLEVWKKGGHKTLLFAQQRIVLDILEKFVRNMQGFTYRRMDGDTPIEQRQNIVDEFNTSPALDVFLLTTKVGGLGVNLTGADRVIIFDPDWNPSTDTQARERAWRLGQKRPVTIYRLMTAGTIEEKIYHRQLFKQFLANKILKDPKSRQTLPMNDLNDLFSLGDEAANGGTETGQIFQGTETQFANGNDGARDDRHRSNGKQKQTTSTDDTEARGLSGVASMEEFKDQDEEAKKQEGDEDRIMNGILAGSGVHSALEHDQVINGKRVIQGDRKMIEREARRVAAEAARGLQRAGEAARNVPIGTPTWTGQYGVAGRPGQPGAG
ncbi:MAG: dual specificity protein kinase yak1, partial [Chaenotheca gracillima]